MQALRFNGFGRSLLSSLIFSLRQVKRDGIDSIGVHTRCLSSGEFECEEVYDDSKAMEKDAALHLALSRLAGDFGKESMLSLQRFFGSRYAPVISTGSLKLDLALGIGGLPKEMEEPVDIGLTERSALQGRIVEIYGQEASGKTTLALHIIKEAQKLGGVFPARMASQNAQKNKNNPLRDDHLFAGCPNNASIPGFMGGMTTFVFIFIFVEEEVQLNEGATGLRRMRCHCSPKKGYCAYLDVENAMDPSLAESIGVNTENLLLSRPDSAENLLSVVNTLAKSGSLNVIVVDSVAALVPQCELDVVIDVNCPDVQSRLMTQALRTIHSSLCQSQTLLIFVNQVRSNLRSGHGFGNSYEVTCGGNALKFYSAVRMRITRTGLLKTENEITGLGVRVQVMKNKLAPAMKKAELEIRFGRGICCESEVLDMACKHGVILTEGNKYYIEGEVLNDKHEAER
ncbi:hypothetical protein HHK36_019729 [Tetracentron sinense]|uniref:Uncharacterized protein n=1 Tax=Tetracentron sinense TaxID=13715 RepID=A0A835D9E2_TETSI|nr:hypothetical protein HHK36_019729 [Tetracentron sinense]